MARSVSSQIIAAYNESQRRAERARQAQERQQRMQQQEMLRAHRAAERARAQYDRSALLAYQQSRENDVAARNTQLTDSIGQLERIVPIGLTVAGFSLDRFRAAFKPTPFDPGALAAPTVMPDPARYEVAPLTGLHARSARARQEYEIVLGQARAAYEEHWRIATAAEQQRQQKLARYQAEYRTWLETERQRADKHNQALDDLARRYAAGDADAVIEFCGMALNSLHWPAAFPGEWRAAWDAAAWQLVVDWELPWYDVVPRVSRYRYVKASDREAEIARPQTERRMIYRRLLAGCVLRVIAELFRADRAGRLASLVVNGFVRCDDPATGRPATSYVASVTVARETFSQIDLTRVDPVSCVEGMRGQLSARPDLPLAVLPVRVPELAGGTVDRAAADGPDLLAMDPIEFEELVAELFRAMGFQAMTTARSGDEGVDIVAVDPDPIRGGRTLVQVKRYRSLIAPAVVRELYGTVVAKGAERGILVTTSGFGPGSRDFAENKPLKLVSGPELVHLLRDHGLPASLSG